MLLRTNPIKNSAAIIAKRLTTKLFHLYVKQSAIDQISKKYGTTNFQKIKMYAAIFQHIGVQGFKGLRADLTLYNQLKTLQHTSPLTPQQTLQMMRINHDMFKVGPLIIIQILPFSGPLFMLYMYTYPGSIPSWFMIDYYHDRHEELKVQNQTKALKYFQEHLVKPENIDLEKMTLVELRKICLLLFGIYRDGTVGYRKLFNKKIPYFLFQVYSKHLIKRDMLKRFNRDLVLKKFTNQMGSLEEMVKWKFERIMKGEFRFEYKPMYEKTIEKMMSNEGEESVMFREIENQHLKTENQSSPNGQKNGNQQNENSPKGQSQNNTDKTNSTNQDKNKK